VNGELFMQADINSTISKNPYLRIKVEGSKGDKVTVTWTDNMGVSGSSTEPSK